MCEQTANVLLHNNKAIRANIYIENDAISSNQWLRHVLTRRRVNGKQRLNNHLK